MGYNDNAVFTAATGYIFTGPVGNAAPTPAELAALDFETYGVDDVASGWATLGHTSEEDLPEFGFDGGEKETRGTWQKKNLREVSTDTPVDYLLMRAQQFDSETLALYYGENTSSTAGVYSVDSSDSPSIERALLLVLVDGVNRIAFSAPKTSIRRDDSIELSTDGFGTLPLRATLTKETGKPLFQWILPQEDVVIP